jgi:NADH-quinone oxidoreductase subunit L
MAATIGLTAYDLKAVLAYSTISQLGFMVAAVGLGGVVAGMFHMTTHAFFKACLFLSAGSVIHGCHHVQDMRLMGGLRKYMPVTFACMLIATIAIAGVPFFAGFYSKDRIIQAGFLRVLDAGTFDGSSLFALLALSTAAALTAFYMFRLIFMTFFGEYRGNLAHHRYSAALAAEGVEGPDPHEHGEEHAGEHAEHGHAHHEVHFEHGHDAHAAAHAHEPHESPKTITIALAILAFLAIFGGHFWLVAPHTAFSGTPWFERLVTPTSLYGEEVGHWAAPEATGHDAEHLEHTAHLAAVSVSLAVAALGIALAWFLYLRRPDLPARIAHSLGLVSSGWSRPAASSSTPPSPSGALCSPPRG